MYYLKCPPAVVMVFHPAQLDEQLVGKWWDSSRRKWDFISRSFFLFPRSVVKSSFGLCDIWKVSPHCLWWKWPFRRAFSVSAACSAPFGFMIAVFFVVVVFFLWPLSSGRSEGGHVGTLWRGRRLAAAGVFFAALARPGVSERRCKQTAALFPSYLSTARLSPSARNSKHANSLLAANSLPIKWPRRL